MPALPLTGRHIHGVRPRIVCAAIVAILVLCTTVATAAEIGCVAALTASALRGEYNDRLAEARAAGHNVSPPKILAKLESGRATDAPVCKGAVIAGVIVAGDARRIGEFLRENPFLQRLYLDADGSNVLEAIEIGRQVRRARLATVAPLAADGDAKRAVLVRDEPSATQNMCAAGAPCRCTGACFYVWAAGIMRTGNVVSPPRDNDTDDTTAELAQMGVSPAWALQAVDDGMLPDPLPPDLRHAPALAKAIAAQCGKEPAAADLAPDQQRAGWRACSELVAVR